MLPGPKMESCYIAISKIAMFSPKKWFKNHNFGISTTESFLTLHTERLKTLTILAEIFFSLNRRNIDYKVDEFTSLISSRYSLT